MGYFRKGEIVHLLTNWNRRGMVRITKAVVHSCGKKQMILTAAETGRELGRHFDPTEGQSNGLVTRETDRAAIEALALSLAQQILATETAHFERCLAGDHSEAYYNAIRKQQAELQSPSFFWAAEKQLP